MRYIFGPVNSRRFGISLGIDLSPGEKSCNFDCLYCELGKANVKEKIKNPPDTDLIIGEVEEFLKKYGYPDVITITANGEPTLYPDLDKLIDKLNPIKGSSRTLILSNGSTIHRSNIAKSLKKLDMVKISLDAVKNETFRKINRPSPSVNLELILNGLKKFRKEFKGELILEVLFVRNVNDSLEEILSLKRQLEEIKPDRIDIGTVDRPPAYRVKPLSDTELYSIATFFEGLPVNVITRNMDRSEQKVNLSEDELLSTFRKRPYTPEDIKTVFDLPTQERIKKMLETGILKEKTINRQVFVTL